MIKKIVSDTVKLDSWMLVFCFDVLAKWTCFNFLFIKRSSCCPARKSSAASSSISLSSRIWSKTMCGLGPVNTAQKVTRIFQLLVYASFIYVSRLRWLFVFLLILFQGNNTHFTRRDNANKILDG